MDCLDERNYRPGPLRARPGISGGIDGAFRNWENDREKGHAMPSDDYARVLNIVGLLVNLGGILILFLWGMPFRVESRGEAIATGDLDPRGLHLTISTSFAAG